MTRRLAELALLAIALIQFARPAAAAPLPAASVDSVAITVSDMDRAVDFYSRC
jgi:hypothetical protein